MARKVFVDMDGVLADFDTLYLERFGVALGPFRSTYTDPPNFWENIRGHGRFFEALPMMADALDLWRGLKTLGVAPIVLSGVSEKTGDDSAEQKRRWVRRWLGKNVPMIFCKSSEKCVFGRAGDVLIDDWTKHQAKWEAMGGVFIVHTSAEESLRQLRDCPESDKESELWTTLGLALDVVRQKLGPFAQWPVPLKDAFSIAIVDRRPPTAREIALTQELAKQFGWESPR